jgi:hypothetical protein
MERLLSFAQNKPNWENVTSYALENNERTLQLKLPLAHTLHPTPLGYLIRVPVITAETQGLMV